MGGEPQNSNPSQDDSAANSKISLDTNMQTMDYKTSSIGKNSVLSFKSPRPFIIKRSKRSESNEPRKQVGGDTIFNNASENIESLTTPNQQKFSTFKVPRSKELDESYKTIAEEKKSESSGNSSQTLKLDSNTGSETKSINKSDEQRDKKSDNTQDSTQFEDSEDTRARSNSGIILRKGNQIDFDAKLGEVIGEGIFYKIPLFNC